MTRLAICTHFTYHSGLSSREVDYMIRYIRDLGFSYARFDLWWSDIEPEPGVIDLGAIEHYMSVFRKLYTSGIKPVVILGTGIPRWIRRKKVALVDEKYYRVLRERYGLKIPSIGARNHGVREKLLEYTVIASSIALRYTEWFQLGNELNNMLVNRDLAGIYGSVEYVVTMYRGLTRSCILHGLTRPRVIVNVFTCIPGWASYLDKMLSRIHRLVDVVGVDHYPGTWCSCRNPCNWRVLDKAFHVARKYGLRVGVMETGYPTGGVSVCRLGNSLDNQVEYIARLFTAITRYLHRLEFLSWYELLDQQHSVFNRITCEGYFGVVKQDLEPKRSYYVLRRMVRKIRGSLTEG